MNYFELSYSGADTLKNIANSSISLANTLCGQCVTEEVEGREFLSFSIPKFYSNFFYNDLVSRVGANVLFFSKYKFYKKAIDISEQSIKIFTLIRALVFAEFDERKRGLMEQIKGYKNFSIDGITGFLLNKDKIEWENIALSVRANLPYLMTNKKECKDFFKCVTNSISLKSEVLYIMESEENFVMNENFEKMHYSFYDLDKVEKEKELLAIILENFPKKLVIYSKSLSKEMYETLDLIFDISS